MTTEKFYYSVTVAKIENVPPFTSLDGAHMHASIAGYGFVLATQDDAEYDSAGVARRNHLLAPTPGRGVVWAQQMERLDVDHVDPGYMGKLLSADEFRAALISMGLIS